MARNEGKIRPASSIGDASAIRQFTVSIYGQRIRLEIISSASFRTVLQWLSTRL